MPPNRAFESAVEAHGLSRRFGQVQALSNVSLSIRRGEFFSLLGPSGCGKTTLLRLIAGLDSPDSGTLKIGGMDAANIPPHRRPVNTVFQSYALFPHLTVRENIAFGLRMKKVPAPEIRTRVDRVLELARISELTGRRPSQLSGGQKQRVALARAVVNEPEVLLLDEPLGALDLKLRKQLQTELLHLQRRLGITFVYVTHDQEEALALSDRIGVMNAGRIEQLAPAQALYERPRTPFVAQFLGSCNLVPGVVREIASSRALVETALGTLRVTLRADDPRPCPGEQLMLGIRPEKARLRPPDNVLIENEVKAVVADTVYSGAETLYRLRVGDHLLEATMLNTNPSAQAFGQGESLVCELGADCLLVLETQTGPGLDAEDGRGLTSAALRDLMYVR